MKLLLDECLPHALRHSFSAHECHTAEWAGFKGLKNGALMSAAEAAGYEVFITADRGILHEQRNRRIAIVLIRPRRTKLEFIEPLIGAVLEALRTIRPGDIVVVP